MPSSTNGLRELWEVRADYVTDNGHYHAPRIFSVSDPDNPKFVAELRVPLDENQARLIAAAPELLEALLKLEEQVSELRAGRTWSRDNVEVIQAQLQAKAAIAKATGVTRG